MDETRKQFIPLGSVATRLAGIRGVSMRAARNQIYRGIQSGKVSATRFFGRYSLEQSEVDKILTGEAADSEIFMDR